MPPESKRKKQARHAILSRYTTKVADRDVDTTNLLEMFYGSKCVNLVDATMAETSYNDVLMWRDIPNNKLPGKVVYDGTSRATKFRRLAADTELDQMLCKTV